MATCTDGLGPGIHVSVALGSDVVAHSVNDHVGNNLREVRKQSQIVIVIGSDVESILFVSTVTLRAKNRDERRFQMLIRWFGC